MCVTMHACIRLCVFYLLVADWNWNALYNGEAGRQLVNRDFASLLLLKMELDRGGGLVDIYIYIYPFVENYISTHLGRQAM